MAAVLGFSLDSIQRGISSKLHLVHLLCGLHLRVAQWKQQHVDDSSVDTRGSPALQSIQSRVALGLSRSILEVACHLGFIKPQMNLRIYRNQFF
jgi:hypothetical protein